MDDKEKKIYYDICSLKEKLIKKSQSFYFNSLSATNKNNRQTYISLMKFCDNIIKNIDIITEKWDNND